MVNLGMVGLTVLVAVTMATVTSGQFVQRYYLILTSWNLHSFNRSGVIVQERRNISHAFTEYKYKSFYDCLRSFYSPYCAAGSSHNPAKGEDFYEVTTISYDTSARNTYYKYNYQCRSPTLYTIVCYRLEHDFDVCAKGLRCRRLFQFFDIDSTVVSFYWTDEDPIYIGGEDNSLGVYNECTRKCRGHATSSSLAMVILVLMLAIYKVHSL